jgi:2-octaprenylphenol hydroxylase
MNSSHGAPRKSADFDIAICGGGMVGATLAALLLGEPALRDLRIALIEAHVPQPPEGDVSIRVSAVSRASQRILTKAGAWQLLQPEQQSPYGDMVVWDALGKPDDALRFSASALGEPDLGHIIANNCLQWVAWEAARHERVTRFAAELTSITLDTDAASSVLADGRALLRGWSWCRALRSISRTCASRRGCVPIGKRR